jgi:hypothetical protein
LTEQRAALATAVEVMGPLLHAAEGLSHGEDWNNGTHAKLHGHREALLAAVPGASDFIRDHGGVK